MAFTTTDQHSGAGTGSGTALHGMKEICGYCGKSCNTVLSYIKNESFPASKIGGEWVSDKLKIDAWRLQRIG